MSPSHVCAPSKIKSTKTTEETAIAYEGVFPIIDITFSVLMFFNISHSAKTHAEGTWCSLQLQGRAK